MTNPLGSISIQDPHVTSSGGSPRGSFNGEMVTAEKSQPRTPSALSTALLSVKHFFVSLFGSRVSTPSPVAITNREEATQSVLHTLTKRNVDTFDVLSSLTQMLQHGNFAQDVNRDGITTGSAQLFRTALADLSDLQLLRLHTNLQKHAEFLEPLCQSGTGAVMELNDIGHENQRAGGVVNDLGFMALSLANETKAALESRGYKVEPVNVDDAQPTPEVTAFARRFVEQEGDLPLALVAARQDIVQLRAELFQQAMRNNGFG